MYGLLPQTLRALAAPTTSNDRVLPSEFWNCDSVTGVGRTGWAEGADKFRISFRAIFACAIFFCIVRSFTKDSYALVSSSLACLKAATAGARADLVNRSAGHSPFFSKFSSLACHISAASRSPFAAAASNCSVIAARRTSAAFVTAAS